MAIDRSSFLLMTGALAAGGAGGYYAHQQGWIGKSSTAQTEPAPIVVERGDAGTGLVAANASAAPTPVSSTVITTAALPLCDDSQGTVGDCPPPGMPTEEGGCGTFVTTRCADFKASMKPRVAEVAVQCLRDLKPNERCDKNRVNLCGHLALVNACAEPDSSSNVMAANVGTGQGTTTNVAAIPSGTTPTTVPVERARPESAAVLCESIIRTVGPSRVGPTLADCKQTLSGMSDTGRFRMVECMKKNWSSKGLLGCEAIDPAKKDG